VQLVFVVAKQFCVLCVSSMAGGKTALFAGADMVAST